MLMYTHRHLQHQCTILVSHESKSTQPNRQPQYPQPSTTVKERMHSMRKGATTFTLGSPQLDRLHRVNPTRVLSSSSLKPLAPTMNITAVSSTAATPYVLSTKSTRSFSLVIGSVIPLLDGLTGSVRPQPKVSLSRTCLCTDS